MNVIDYIKKHKDDSFDEFPFTEVDNLIFALIPYLDFKDVIPSFKGKKITLRDAVNSINDKKPKKISFFLSNTFKMLNIMKDTKRYKDVLLYNYMNIVNKDMQFSAVTIRFKKRCIYIAFAGTDSSIIGWKEDFKMAYFYPVASQKYAAIYLNKAISLKDKFVYLGGHSKGGNLAISAAMKSKFYFKNKIKTIYNNDGPGFLKEQVVSSNYKKIKNKIKMYVPKESIIGMILYHVEDYVVVKAKSFNILQHDAFNWVCNDTAFIRATQTKRSKNLEAKLTKKLEELPVQKRLDLVESVFDIFKNNNIFDIKDITINKLFSLMKNITYIDKESLNMILELAIILFIK